MRSRSWLPASLVALLLFPMIEQLGAQSGTIYLPHDIQGPGATSPFPSGTAVIVRGVVTARKKAVDFYGTSVGGGFFIQTEPAMDDGNPNTSEGLFVSVGTGAPVAAQVGQLVEVHGSVGEFVPDTDTASPSRTELNVVTLVVDLGLATMPAPHTLTLSEMSAAGSLDQLERFEGMRVMAASLTSITGTGADQNQEDGTWANNGTFYAVLTGQARPFREAGIERGYPMVPCEAGSGCDTPIFDGNPERLRVDSDALEGTAAVVDVSSGALIEGAVGPLDFGSRTYTLLPEGALTVGGGTAETVAPAASADRFTIASFHMKPAIEATRMAKASLMIRTVLNYPDVLGVQEVEDIVVLEQLSAWVDADALENGDAAPEYEPWLLPGGGDPDGLNIGVLVKTAGGRVSVTEATQVGDANTYDRPPVVLRVLIQEPGAPSPFPVTVIVNSMRSRADIGLNDETGFWARDKRREQAELLADFIQPRQVADPPEAVVLIGDFNAFGFNDGLVDTVGTVLGTPAPAHQVAAVSGDVVDPDLVNLAEFMVESERYSSLDNGNAQTLEHAIVTSNLVAHFRGVVHPRVNADFADVLRDDATTPQRVSERDPLVAYFSFTPDTEGPVFSTTPDLTVEATSAGGATVTYATPTATDTVFGDADVVCGPASGTAFLLGPTTVTCTAADTIGNVASVSFMVTVSDTIAPQLTVPANITEQATSPAGRVVTYTVTATDAVTGSPDVTCAPASGATFTVGVTTVQCSAVDAVGNSSAASFTVTITPAESSGPRRMYGIGTVGSGRAQAAFGFDVKESANHVDRGFLVLKVGSYWFVACVTDVVFAGPDSVTFSGSGWWNGRPGHTFEAGATDQGKPGRGRDTFTVVVRAPSGKIVAATGGLLTSGNNQAVH